MRDKLLLHMMQIVIIITCVHQLYMLLIPDTKFPDICIYTADYSLQMCKILIALVFVYVWVICFFQVQEKTLSMHLRSEESWGSKLQQRQRLARSKVWRAERRKCTHWRKHCIKFQGSDEGDRSYHNKLSIVLYVVSMHPMQMYKRLCSAESSSYWK